MPISVSPYELLCASKPRQLPTVVTAYDMYSAAQMPSATAPSVSIPNETSSGINGNQQLLSAYDASFASLAPPASSRTHYIADIHARHNAATRSCLRRHI